VTKVFIVARYYPRDPPNIDRVIESKTSQYLLAVVLQSLGT
jgi:hypothetical protein